MVRHCDIIEEETERCCINYVIVDKVMLAKGNYSFNGMSTVQSQTILPVSTQVQIP